MSSEKFNRDLKLGEKAEQWFLNTYLPRYCRKVTKMKGYFKPYDVIATKNDGVCVTFEIKREGYNLHHESNNICIEYEYNEKPSGVKGTRADNWVHFFYDNQAKNWKLLIANVMKFREWILENTDKIGNSEAGGDESKSKNFVIPVSLLLQSKFHIEVMKTEDIYIDLNKETGYKN